MAKNKQPENVRQKCIRCDKVVGCKDASGKGKRCENCKECGAFSWRAVLEFASHEGCIADSGSRYPGYAQIGWGRA